MGINYNAKSTVDESLLLYLDAANPKSVGDGSYWYNLVSSTALLKYGTPTVSTVGGATAYLLDTSGDYFYGDNVLAKSPTSQLTFEAWIYPMTEITSGDRGCIMLITGSSSAYMSWNKSNLTLSNYWYGHTPEGYHETGSAMPRDSWHHICSVWNGSTLYQYTDMVKTSVSVTGSASSGTNLRVGYEGDARQFSGGIAMVKIYNKALSDEEILQNYNSAKGRFGL